MNQRRNKAARQLLTEMVTGRGGEILNFSFDPEGVTVRLKKPWGQYNQKQMFYSWHTVDELQRDAAQEAK